MSALQEIPETTEQINTFVRYAGFWWRALAIIIDVGLIVVAVLIVTLGSFFLYFGKLDPSKSANGSGFETLGQLITSSIFWIYFTIFESSRMQSTLGKKICGLRVTDLSGNRISFARANGRYFAKTLSFAVYLVGFSVAAVTRRKQGWHDMISDCLVLRTRTPGPYYIPPPLPKAPWWRWVLSLPLALLVPIAGILALNLL